MTPSGFPIDAVLEDIRHATADMGIPVVTEVAQYSRNPFRVLIATLISLRTKDQVTAAASAKLFAVADRPGSMAELPPEQIAKLIYPAGFYKVKAQTILAVCQRLINEFDGRVPDDLDTLMSFSGVGRKTANLVLTEGFHLPGICVDIHVHRICNRLGYIRTKLPDQTELRLRQKLDQRWWIPINALLVTFGQHICRPVSPFCSRCPVSDRCRKVGVANRR